MSPCARPSLGYGQVDGHEQDLTYTLIRRALTLNIYKFYQNLNRRVSSFMFTYLPTPLSSTTPVLLSTCHQVDRLVASPVSILSNTWTS